MSSARADRVAEEAARRGLDAIIVGDLVRPGDSSPDAISDIRWLTGFTGSSGLAIVGDGRRMFMTDFRYEERARKEVFPNFEREILSARMLAELASRLRGKVGFDPGATSVASLRKLQEEIADGAQLIEAEGVLEQLRRTKDPSEVEAIAEATRIADEALEAIVADGLAGRTEREVARAIQAEIRRREAEPSFSAIVAASENGAQPHAEPSDREILAGELVVIDWGAQVAGYCSDGTRTFATGAISDEAREVYELVERAQQAALDAIGPGVSGVAADAAARGPIDQAGHAEHFGHGLGHGVGLEVHEAPRVSPRSDDELRVGDVVTVEPGVYIPGEFGVRIEDIVLVTEQGHRNFSSTPKSLRDVG